jgi:hypothetical protein
MSYKPLPTPNSHKTLALVVHILQSQRLPPEVLDGPAVEEVVRVLSCVLVHMTESGKIIKDTLMVGYAPSFLFTLTTPHFHLC